MGMHMYVCENQEQKAAIEAAEKEREKCVGIFCQALKAGNLEEVQTAAVAVTMLSVEVLSIEAGAKPLDNYNDMKSAYEALLTRKEDVKTTYKPIETKGFEFRGFSSN